MARTRRVQVGGMEGKRTMGTNKGMNWTIDRTDTLLHCVDFDQKKRGGRVTDGWR
jgi:hypothetical protein